MVKIFENIVQKGENASKQLFSFLHNIFEDILSQDHWKSVW